MSTGKGPRGRKGTRRKTWKAVAAVTAVICSWALWAAAGHARPDAATDTATGSATVAATASPSQATDGGETPAQTAQRLQDEQDALLAHQAGGGDTTVDDLAGVMRSGMDTTLAEQDVALGKALDAASAPDATREDAQEAERAYAEWQKATLTAAWDALGEIADRTADDAERTLAPVDGDGWPAACAQAKDLYAQRPAGTATLDGIDGLATWTDSLSDLTTECAAGMSDDQWARVDQTGG